MLRYLKVVFIASVAVVAADLPQSRVLFMGALGLPLEGEGDGYYSSGSIPGGKHFGAWPLSEAAQACFGLPAWPAGRGCLDPVGVSGVEPPVGPRGHAGALTVDRCQPDGVKLNPRLVAELPT
jgi:hypothetical protein